MAKIPLTKNDRIKSRAIEINVADHCNLSCRGCAHFSPIARKHYLKPEDLSKPLKWLAEAMEVEYVELLGGEPLLNRQLLRIIEEVLTSGITRHIQIDTNGVILWRMDKAFWEAVDVIQLCEYPNKMMTLEQKEHCKEMADKHDVVLDVLQHSHFREIYTEQASNDPQLVRRVFDSCQIAHKWKCYTVWENHFFKCPQTIFLQQYLQLDTEDFETKIEDGIEITADPDFPQKLRTYLEDTQPLKWCKNCLGSTGKRYPHEQLPRVAWRQPQQKPYDALVDKKHLNRLEHTDADADGTCFTRAEYW